MEYSSRTITNLPIVPVVDPVQVEAIVGVGTVYHIPTYSASIPPVFTDSGAAILSGILTGISEITTPTLSLNISGTTGSSGQILKAAGDTTCSWVNPSISTITIANTLSGTLYPIFNTSISGVVSTLDANASASFIPGNVSGSGLFAYGLNANISQDLNIIQGNLSGHNLNVTNTCISGSTTVTTPILSLSINTNSGSSGNLLTADGTGKCNWIAPATSTITIANTLSGTLYPIFNTSISGVVSTLDANASASFIPGNVSGSGLFAYALNANSSQDLNIIQGNLSGHNLNITNTCISGITTITSPILTLSINGNSGGSGNVLMSSSTGKASWQPPSAPNIVISNTLSGTTYYPTLTTTVSGTVTALKGDSGLNFKPNIVLKSPNFICGNGNLFEMVSAPPTGFSSTSTIYASDLLGGAIYITGTAITLTTDTAANLYTAFIAQGADVNAFFHYTFCIATSASVTFAGGTNVTFYGNTVRSSSGSATVFIVSSSAISIYM